MKYIFCAYISLFWSARLQQCKGVNVSSDDKKYSDDMVSKGVTSPKWVEGTSKPIIIGY